MTAEIDQGLPKMRYEAKRKPKKCPKCGHSPLASIFYGEPDFSNTLQEKLDKGFAVLGGCAIDITYGIAVWRCVKCNTDIYKEDGDAPAFENSFSQRE